MGRCVLRSLAAVLLGVSLCVASAHRARALEDYADEIAKQLKLADKPSCHYCHAVGADGVATDTAFGDALKTRGFSRRNGLPSLRRALERLEEDRVDSDGDGDTDMDELVAATNPNDPTDQGIRPQGCSVSFAGTVNCGAGWICLAAAACWLARRFRLKL